MATELPTKEDGSLLHYTFPGSYEVAYYCADGQRLCYACAVEHRNDDDDGAPEFADIYWEGSDDYCGHCNVVCSSEYGDPEEGEEENE